MRSKKYLFLPYHESIILTLRDVRIRTSYNLDTLEVILGLIWGTVVPQEYILAVQDAVGLKLKELEHMPGSPRRNMTIGRCKKTLRALAQQKKKSAAGTA